MTEFTLRMLYADDLQIYLQVPSYHIKNGVNLLFESVRKVATWAVSNHLMMNSKKTKAIGFGSSYTIKTFKNLNIPDICINNNGDLVPFVNEITSLGVIFDETLSWPQQITNKVNQALYGLKFIRPCTTRYSENS